MSTEIWKPIKEYVGIYEVSNMGRIRSLNRKIPSKNNSFCHIQGQIIMPIVMKSNGYCKVSLKDNGRNKQKLIHRLVAEAFIPNPENKSQVNHKKGIKTDNRASELEWNTPIENLTHAAVFGLSISKISKNILNQRKIKQYSLNYEFIKEWHSVSEIERYFGFSKSNIHKRINGKKKNNIAYGFIWEYSVIQKIESPLEQIIKENKTNLLCEAS